MATRLAMGLKLLFPAMFSVMLATLIYTISIDGLPFPGRSDVFTPWFATTVVDFYVNIVPLAVWIAYKESTWLASACWVILLLFFGSLTTCAYVFLQLVKLTPEEASQDLMYHLLLRDSDRDKTGGGNTKSPVITARFVFGGLGCLMLVTLIYTILTDGSPFRTDLLYPWMVALLLSFYIHVVALTIWIFYKESSWISGTLWLLLLICLGSVGTSIYIVVKLFSLSSHDQLYLLLLPNRNRAGKMYERTTNIHTFFTP